MLFSFLTDWDPCPFLNWTFSKPALQFILDKCWGLENGRSIWFSCEEPPRALVPLSLPSAGCRVFNLDYSCPDAWVWLQLVFSWWLSTLASFSSRTHCSVLWLALWSLQISDWVVCGFYWCVGAWGLCETSVLEHSLHLVAFYFFKVHLLVIALNCHDVQFARLPSVVSPPQSCLSPCHNGLCPCLCLDSLDFLAFIFIPLFHLK